MYRPWSNPDTRSSVLAALREGADAAAWSRFFDLYASFVFLLARRRGLQDADADEIVQTVFSELAAEGGAIRHDPAKGSFRDWLARRVDWRVTDLLRARRAGAAVLSDADPADLDRLPDPAAPGRPLPGAPAPADAALDAAWAEAVRDEALRRLRPLVRPEHFAVFVASAIEELDSETVRRVHRISPENLWQIRRRVGALFREQLAAAARDMDGGLA